MTGQPKRIEVKLQGASEKVVRRLNLRMFQTLTSATPVDTGFARGSLTPATGSPVADALERPADTETARQQAAANFSDNSAKAKSISGTYKLGQGRVFLTFRAPYVKFLNEGSSSQAPKKFVERAIKAAIRSL